MLLVFVFSVSVMLERMKQSWVRRTFTLRIMQAHVYTQGDPICVLLLFFLCCRNKEEQLVRLRDSQMLQAQQAESALEKFKKQVELSSEKTYADMKQQVSQGQLQFTLCYKVYESNAHGIAVTALASASDCSLTLWDTFWLKSKSPVFGYYADYEEVMFTSFQIEHFCGRTNHWS